MKIAAHPRLMEEGESHEDSPTCPRCGGLLRRRDDVLACDLHGDQPGDAAGLVVPSRKGAV